MAIATNDTIHKFDTANRTALGNTTSLIASAGFSDGTNDLNTHTMAEDTPLLAVELKFALAVAAGTFTNINLYARITNVGASQADSTPIPTANFPHIFLGTFPVKDGTTSDQVVTLLAPLPNIRSGQIYEFYIENLTGQQINAGWEMWVTEATVGPK